MADFFAAGDVLPSAPAGRAPAVPEEVRGGMIIPIIPTLHYRPKKAGPQMSSHALVSGGKDPKNHLEQAVEVQKAPDRI